MAPARTILRPPTVCDLTTIACKSRVIPCPPSPPLRRGYISSPQSDVAARKTLLRLSESAWADALIELALCERDLDDGVSSAAMASASEDEGAASRKVVGGEGKGEGVVILMRRRCRSL